VISKKQRERVVAEIAWTLLEKTREVCPECVSDLPPDAWSEESRKNFDMITNVGTAVEARLRSLLNALSCRPPRKRKTA
jgi:hypothetical protein